MTASRALSNNQILRAAGIALLGFLASGVLGLVRQAVLSATFGTSAASDAFSYAQRIPEFIFVLVAGGALGSSFIPVFNRHLLHQDDQGAWQLASAVITLSSLAAAVLSLLVALFAPWIVSVILAPGEPEIHEVIVSLTRIMMLTPFIFSISGLLMGILQTHGNFLLPSLAISMNPIGQIFGALVLARLITPQPGSLAQVGTANVYGVAWGAVLSAILHLLVQLPGLNNIKTRYTKLRPLADWRIPGVLTVLALMGPRVLGLGIAQLNFIVNANFASHMVTGSQTAINYAWTMMFFVLGIIAQSVGTAVFPTLAALVAENNMEGFRDRLARALRSVLFLALPATVGIILLGRPLLAIIFEHGNWTAESTTATAWALSFYAVGIAGHASLEVLSRAFYALSDTRTPVMIGVLSLVANIVLSAVFIQFIGEPGSLQHGPFAGLALANSITTLLEALALWWLLRRRVGGMNDNYLLDGIARTAGASVAMLVALLVFEGLVMSNMNPTIGALLGAVLGGVVFVGASLALKMEELRTVFGAVLRRVKR